MIHLLHQHRENHDSHWRENRLVFEAETPEPEEVKAEAIETPEVTPATFTRTEHFGALRSKARDHVQKMTEAFGEDHPAHKEAEELASALKKEIEKKFDQLHDDYEAKLGEVAADYHSSRGDYLSQAEAFAKNVKERIDGAEPQLKETYIKNNLDKLQARLAESMGMDPSVFKKQPALRKLGADLLATLDWKKLAPDKEEVELSDEEYERLKKIITKQLPKAYKKIEEDEADLVQLLGKKAFEDIGADRFQKGKGLNDHLARSHKIEKSDEGFMVDGTLLTADNRADLFPELKKVLDADESDRDTKFTALEKEIKEAGTADEVRGKILEAIEANLKKPESKKGFMESIVALMQAWAAIKAAFESKPPDFTTLSDVLSDVTANPPRNPAEEMKKSRANFDKIFAAADPKPGVEGLLSIYLNPRGEEADVLLSDEAAGKAGVENAKELTRYRAEMRPVILAHLGKVFGIKIASIEQSAETGITTLTGYQGNKKVEIEFSGSGEQFAAQVFDQFSEVTNAEGEKVVQRGQGRPVEKMTPEGIKIELATAAETTPPPATTEVETEVAEVDEEKTEVEKPAAEEAADKVAKTDKKEEGAEKKGDAAETKNGAAADAEKKEESAKEA